MTTPHHPDDFLHDLRDRSAAEGGVFWINDDLLAVFEPDAARKVSAANWHGLLMNDRFVDMLRRRGSATVPWARVRTEWRTRLHALATAEHHGALIARMERTIDARLGDDIDLVLLAQDVAVRALLPVALSGLTARESAWIVQDLDQKLMRLIDRSPGSELRHQLHFAAVQFRAGLVVRRILRERAAGRRAREHDLADPFVDLLPELGMDRALDVVTAVLTAIGGPPGAAAASVLYELARQPRWTRRLTVELRATDPETFRADPVKAAPLTHRFVKEVLRMWSPPLLLMRHARTSFDLGGTTLAEGRGYVLSPHMIHRDHRFWRDADTFDPDRFLPGAPHGPLARGCYVPFGWAPKKCAGADIGTVQLMALCYLMCTRYHLDVPDAEHVTMAYRFAPVPQKFHGRITLSRAGHQRP
ncbi:cytochrome P450 [Streptomyces sp. NPDC058284]|uniref:cytochrome P450 n=1 Tax=unclassified Streptomyces TaxID=2593676 RepID=UPI003660BD89